MTSTRQAQGGLMRELTEQDCWWRLAQHNVGRLAYVHGTGPVILPLSYLARDGRIWLRTASYNQLAVHAPGQQAAFEIDEIDEHGHTGWSVLVRGPVEHVLNTQDLGIWPEPVPWPEGIRTMMLCLIPTDVTGRSLARADVVPAAGGPGSIQRSAPDAPS